MHWQKHWKRFIQNTPLVSHPKVWWNPIPKLRHITCLNQSYFPSQSYYLFKPSYLLPQFKLDHFTPASIYACARPRGNNPFHDPILQQLAVSQFSRDKSTPPGLNYQYDCFDTKQDYHPVLRRRKKWYIYHWFAQSHFTATCSVTIFKR